jgi:hypothetical protein
LLAVFGDALTGALLLVAGVAILMVLRDRIVLPIALGALTALVIRMPHGATGPLECGLFLVVVWAVARRGWSRGTALVTAYASLLAIELARMQHDFGSSAGIFYREGGSDFLRYESYAHEILAGSLRGGDPVFIWSPAFPYLLAGGHTLFGNGDARLSLVAMLALTFAIFACGLACVLRDEHSTAQRIRNWSATRRGLAWTAGACVAVCASLLLATNHTVVGMVRASQSEAATWILVPAALTLLLHTRRSYAFVGAAVLAGVAVITRFDQGIGLIFLLLCGAVALWQRKRPDRYSWRLAVIAGLAVFAAIALLPAIHNLHYGGRFVVLPETPRIPVNFPLPPGRLIRVCCDSSVRGTFVSQLRGVTVLDAPSWGRPEATARFAASVALLQVLWLASLMGLWLNRRKSSPTMFMVAALPLAFLLPHISLQVYVYYPRHVVVGYLMMGLAAAFVMGELARRDNGRTAPTAAGSPAGGRHEMGLPHAEPP